MLQWFRLFGCKMDVKFKSKTHLQNIFFNILIHFVRVWLNSLPKVKMYPQKYFFQIFSMWVSIKRRIYANFESVQEVAKKFTGRKLESWGLLYIFYTFMLIAFFMPFYTCFSILCFLKSKCCEKIVFCSF